MKFKVGDILENIHNNVNTAEIIAISPGWYDIKISFNNQTYRVPQGLVEEFYKEKL